MALGMGPSSEKMLKKAVFFCSHHPGHIHAILCLVQIFVHHQVECHFIADASVQTIIEDAGAVFCPLEPSLKVAAMHQVTAKFNCRPSHSMESASFFEQILPATVFWLPTLLERLERLRPNLVVADTSAVWGMLAAKILHIPIVSSCATAVLASNTLFSHLRELDYIKLCVKWLKQTHGIDFDPADSYFAPTDFTISWSIPEFSPKTNLRKIWFFGAATKRDFWESSERERKQEQFCPGSVLQETQQRLKPSDRHWLIYCSLGTVVGHTPWTTQDGDFVRDYYQQLFVAIGNDPCYTCIVALGGHRSVESIGPIPSNVIVRNWLPQLLVLQEADIFLTHCGNNGYDNLFCTWGIHPILTTSCLLFL